MKPCVSSLAAKMYGLVNSASFFYIWAYGGFKPHFLRGTSRRPGAWGGKRATPHILHSITSKVVLDDNGSVRWKVVLIGTWEPPTLHETDVRCYQAQGARSAVRCERATLALRRSARSLCSASNTANVHGRGVQGDPLHVTSQVDEESLEDPVVGEQAGSPEAGEIPAVNAVTEGIEITYVDCDPSDDEPASPAYSPTAPVYCPTSS
ncbi:hypothetical protein CYMTET_41362 [Cymbomonas tetramitiformis]|uniref:Uncharacterized protein n=1 Tax=Cymbomonas tetramitiformis TaxID=36881 RepID=A0AAE0C816_9CHLO|nr:hypothetical protein CYMTET_41362 [Cymbomonas tetramitiformis]